MRWWRAALGVCLAATAGCRGSDVANADGAAGATTGDDAGAARDAGPPRPADAGRETGVAPDAGGLAPPGAVAPEPPAELGACGTPLMLSGAMRLAPVDPGQRYVRCGTYGPEQAWHVTLSPGGRFLAAQTSAGTVRLVDVQRWREVAQFASPVGRLDAVAFSPDGLHLATLSAEAGEVTTWRTADGAVERSWALTPGSTIDTTQSSLAYAADGRTIVTSLGVDLDVLDDPGTLEVVDTSGPVATETPQVDPESTADGVAFPSLQLVANDTAALVQGDYQVGDSNVSTRLLLYPLPAGPPIELFDAWKTYLEGYAASPDGQLVAFASGVEPSAGLHLASAATGAEIASDPTFIGSVLAFAPDSATLYVQEAGVVLSLDARTLRPLGSFQLGDGDIFKAVAPNGDLVAIGAGSTSWWDPATGTMVRSVPFAADQIAWSRDGGLEVLTGGGALFHAYRAADGAELCASPAGGPTITYLTTSPAGGQIGYGYEDGTVEVASARGSAATMRVQTGTTRILDLAIADTGERVAVSGLSPGLHTTPQPAVTVFDMASGATLAAPVITNVGISSVLSTDGTELAMSWQHQSTFFSEVRVLNVDSGAVLLDVQPTASGTFATADHFGPAGNELAVATEHGVDAWPFGGLAPVKNFGSASRTVSPDWSYVAETLGGGVAVVRVLDDAIVGSFTTGDVPSGATFAADDQLFAAPVLVTRTHGVDYHAEHVWDLATGARLRILPAAPNGGAAGTFALPGDGAEMLTLDTGAVDIWCR